MIIKPKLIKDLDRSDFRALFVISIVGIIVGIFWWINATLVYDDIAFPANFSGLVNSMGWFKSLIKIFVLDLPNEYRTYGLSRVIQFVIWSVGGASVNVYILLISFSQVATALVIYILLKISLGFERIIALSVGLMWLLSPFIWTSCFHHYSYLILPIQITIVGSYFLITTANPKRLMPLAVLLGMAIALTGELHLIAASFILFAIASVSGKRSSLQASFLAIVSTVLTIIVHHSIWYVFAADRVNHQRFAISFSHDISLWTYRFFVATRGIGRSVVEQISQIAGSNITWLVIVTTISTSVVFFSLSWVMGQYKKDEYKSEVSKYSSLRLAGALFISSFLCLVTFVMVVVLADSVPSSMPRRYGYIPLTIMLIAFVITLSSLRRQRLYRIFILSLMIGVMMTLFIRHQGILLPEERKVDDRISKMLRNEIKKNPTKPVLFFNSSKIEYPLVSLDDTLGIAMRDVTSAEVVQAKYSTYWPAYINTTGILGAPYTCGLGNIQDGQIKLACPPWQENPGTISGSNAIIVANLGFDKFDPLGTHVQVFKSFDDFKPYFFSRMIVTGDNPDLEPRGDFFGINLDESLPNIDTGTIFLNKEFTAPPVLNPDSWLKNYGSVYGSNKLILEYAFNFSESDLNVYLDFNENLKKKAGGEFEVQVSWNKESWVSLGKLDSTKINNGKPFSIRLSHLSTREFEFKLISETENKKTPLIKSIRIQKWQLPES